MKGKYAFFELPAPSSLKTEKGMLNFRKKIKEEEAKNEDTYMLQIKFLIYIKLFFYLWEVKDYSEFKQIFLTSDTKKIQLLGPSIIKCLEASDYTIYEELNRFSKETSWYPKIIKNENNIYINQPIRSLDVFFVIDNLEKYMNQFIAKYGEELNKRINETDNYYENIIQDDFYKKFDEQFLYLENYDLFKDVYINIKKEGVSKLTQHIYKLKTKERAKVIKSECWGPSHEAIKSGRGQTDYKNRLRRNGDIIEKQRVKQLTYPSLARYRKY